MKNDDIKPDWALVKLDERKYWREDIRRATKEIYGVYAFNRNSYTYCCEATPSYELHFIANDYVEINGLTEDQQNDLDEHIVSSRNDAVIYLHVGFLEDLMKVHPERFKNVGKIEIEEDDAPRDQLNDTIDFIAENWGTGALVF